MAGNGVHTVAKGAGTVDVLAVMNRLAASVDDDDIELDARADLAREAAAASAAVAELIAAANQVSKETGDSGCNMPSIGATDRLRAALVGVGVVRSFGVKNRITGLWFGGFELDGTVKWVAESSARSMDELSARAQATLLDIADLEAADEARVAAASLADSQS
jgi:hypothetical protein